MKAIGLEELPNGLAPLVRAVLLEALDRREPFEEVPVAAFDDWLQSLPVPETMTRASFRRLFFDVTNGIWDPAHAEAMTALWPDPHDTAQPGSERDTPLGRWMEALPAPEGVSESYWKPMLRRMLRENGFVWGVDAARDARKLCRMISIGFVAPLDASGVLRFRFTKKVAADWVKVARSMGLLPDGATVGLTDGLCITQSRPLGPVTLDLEVELPFGLVPNVRDRLSLFAPSAGWLDLTPSNVFLAGPTGAGAGGSGMQEAFLRRLNFVVRLADRLEQVVGSAPKGSVDRTN